MTEFPYFNSYHNRKFTSKPEFKKVVIGIHGLAPKVPEKVLREYWYKSITDGLIYSKTGKMYSSADERNDVLPWDSFRMAYWAKFMYHRPLKKDIQSYLPLEYPPQRQSYPWCGISMRKCFTDICGCVGDSFRKEVGCKCSEALASKIGHFKDATDYWSDNFQRTGIQQTVKSSDLRYCLKSQITDAINEDKEVLVVSHSMGTMISYDVLEELPKDYMDKITWITLGSPLGLPIVKTHVKNTDSIKTKEWCNFSDLKDPVCFDAHLEDDYSGVKDHIVCNEYTCISRDGTETNCNNHKSYGYLRCPEVTDVIERFCCASDENVASI